MRSTLTITTVVALLCGSVAARAERAITKDQQTLTISCGDDTKVTIVSNRNRLAIAGKCEAVRVLGNNNHISVASVVAVDVSGNDNSTTLELVDRIQVLGNNNTISYRGAVDAKQKTRVQAPGNGNKISKIE